MLSNLKLSTRLMLGFAFISLAAAAIGLMGMRALSATAEAEQQNYQRVTLGLINLKDMAVRMEQARVQNRNLVLAQSDEQRQEHLQKIAATYAEFDKSAESFKGTIQRDQTRQAFDDLVRDVRPVKDYTPRIAPLAAAGKRDEAYRMLTVEAVPAVKAAQAAMDRLAQLKQEAAKLELDANLDRAASARTTMLIASIIAVLAALGIGTVIARTVTEPLRKATAIAESGDLSARLNIQSDDEVGRLAKAIDAMTERLERKTQEAQTIAGGDLTLEVAVASEQDSLGRAFRTMVENLRKLVTEVRGAFTGVTTGATEISDASQSLSQGATEQASSLEEITSSMTEVASQAKTSSENAGQASHLASSARDAAQQGSQRMQSMVAAMNDINGSSQQIAKIIKVIDDIAFQTNLLALNAAVEAARAGKHGKGFAVVAEEVRNLASRSAKAARETAELIDASGKKVQNGLQVAQGTSGSFEAIVANVVKAADLVGEIAAASKEQAAGIGQISQGLTQIDQVTQRNTASAEETASAAQELSSSASKIEQLFGRFRLGNDAPAQVQVQARTKPTGKPRANGKRPPAKSAAPSGGWGNGAALAKREPEPPDSSTGDAVQPQDVIALDDKEFGRY